MYMPSPFLGARASDAAPVSEFQGGKVALFHPCRFTVQAPAAREGAPLLRFLRCARDDPVRVAVAASSGSGCPDPPEARGFADAGAARE